MTHISMTIFLLSLIAIGLVALWIYTHRNRLRQVKKTQLFRFSRARGKLIGPPVITIRLAEGVFVPDRINLQINAKFKLRFIRQDASPSAADVYIPYFHQQIPLNMNQPEEVIVMFKEVGQFMYTCSNGLYKGWIVVTH